MSKERVVTPASGTIRRHTKQLSQSTPSVYPDAKRVFSPDELDSAQLKAEQHANAQLGQTMLDELDRKGIDAPGMDYSSHYNTGGLMGLSNYSAHKLVPAPKYRKLRLLLSILIILIVLLVFIFTGWLPRF